MSTTDSGSTLRIDAALGRYYRHKGRNDYFDPVGVGKFFQFCHDNGFEDDDVKEEIYGDAEECMLCEFDDNFPVIPNNESDKNQEIHSILKSCYDGSLILTIENTKQHIASVVDFTKGNTQEIKETKEIYRKQCKGLFIETEQTNLLKLLTIGRLHNLPLLSLLVDSYTRDRIAYYLSNKKMLNITDWVHKSPIITRLQSSCTANTSLKDRDFRNQISSAMEEFFSRYNGKISLAPMTKINGSTQRFIAPVLDALNFVHHQRFNFSRYHGSNMPFQIDLMIIPPPSINHDDDDDDDTDDTDDDDDDDDDDDSSDGDDDEKKEKDIIGSISERIENCLHRERKRVRPHDDDNDKDYIYGKKDEGYSGFEPRFLGKLFEMNNKSILRNKRYCVILDLRTGTTNQYLLEPPTANVIGNKIVEEALMQLSYDCVLPGTEELQPITASNAQSQVCVISIQALETNKVKCYWYRQSQVSRFFPQDMLTLWPIYFEVDEIKLDQIKTEINEMSTYFQTFDDQFAAFYEPIEVILTKRSTADTAVTATTTHASSPASTLHNEEPLITRNASSISHVIFNHPTIIYIMNMLNIYLKWNQSMESNNNNTTIDKLKEHVGDTLTNVLNEFHEALILTQNIEDFEKVSTLCRQNDPSANIQNSRIVKRHYNYAERTDNDLYYNLDDHHDIVFMTVLDTIYIYFNFAFELGMLNTHEMKQIIMPNRGYGDDDDEKEVNDSDFQFDIIKLKAIVNKKIGIKQQSPASKRVEAERFITKVANDSNNRYDSDEKNTEIIFKNDPNVYKFGKRFLYWTKCKHNTFYVKAKYSERDFKQEILQHVKMHRWNEMVVKAQSCIDTDKMKKLINHKENKLKTELIAEYGLETIQFEMKHMEAILFYTDFTELQRIFTETFRPKSNETLAQWISRHSVFANWSRLLRESVEIFGTVFRKKKTFYHGVNKRLLFTHTIAAFCSPTSMTTFSAIAEGFAGDEGIVVTLGKYEEINYLNVSGVSAFPYEKERLFVGGYKPLQILEIYETIGIKHGKNSAVPVVTILNELILGRAEKKLKAKNIKSEWWYALIEYSMELMDKGNDEIAWNPFEKKDVELEEQQKWDYSSKLWKCCTKNVTETVLIDFAVIKDKYGDLTKILIPKNILFCKRNDHIWIEIDSLCAIFPNAQQLLIRNSETNDKNHIIELVKEFTQSKCIAKSHLEKIMIEVGDIDVEQQSFANWTLNQSQNQVVIQKSQI